MHVITDFQLSLDASHVLRGQGIDPARARPKVVAGTQEVLDEAQALFAPIALYTILPVRNFEHQRVILGGGAVSVPIFEGSLVAQALAGATDVALAVCTIGPGLEERVETLFARSLAGNGVGWCRHCRPWSGLPDGRREGVR